MSIRHLSWIEVRARAVQFSRDPIHVRARSERAEKQTFWNDFFEVFGLRRALLASFEENVRNLKGNTAASDLLWKSKLLVEHKSYGEDPSRPNRRRSPTLRTSPVRVAQIMSRVSSSCRTSPVWSSIKRKSLRCMRELHDTLEAGGLAAHDLERMLVHTRFSILVD